MPFAFLLLLLSLALPATDKAARIGHFIDHPSKANIINYHWSADYVTADGSYCGQIEQDNPKKYSVWIGEHLKQAWETRAEARADLKGSCDALYLLDLEERKMFADMDKQRK